jgi:hypothetical protein
MGYIRRPCGGGKMILNGGRGGIGGDGCG